MTASHVAVVPTVILCVVILCIGIGFVQHVRTHGWPQTCPVEARPAEDTEPLV